MKIAFVGGGSFRVLPIVRSTLAQEGVLADGEIRLADLNLAKAEAVGRLIQRSPEYQGSDCRVSWTNDLDRALDGADVLYVTMAVGPHVATRLSSAASVRRGFLSSDQLSVTGAFLSLCGGPIILNFARRMEKRCPAAVMLIFANPVAVYSGMVNNHTGVRALGVCGGFGNHRWDLTRLLTGRDEYRDEYDVDVAGINHLSFILDGKWRGRDLYRAIDRRVAAGWTQPHIGNDFAHLRGHIRYALNKLVEMRQRFGKIIFSTEGDGMAHLFYEEMFERAHRHYRPPTLAAIRREAKAGAVRRGQLDRDFCAWVDRELPADFWRSDGRRNPWFGRADHDVAVPVFRALAGRGRARIVASAPNRGTVAGFKDRTVLEYSQVIDRRGPRPAGHYQIPDCLHGLISNLATHQTLLGDAIPREFQAARDYL